MVDELLTSSINDAPFAFTGLVRANAAVVIPFASDEPLGVTFAPDEIERGQVVEAVGWLAAASAAMRAQAENALFTAYSEAVDDGACDYETPQAELDWEAENTGTFVSPVAPACASDIWSLVRLHTVHVAPDRSGAVMFDIQGEAAWDGEHGVALRMKNQGPLGIAKGY